MWVERAPPGVGIEAESIFQVYRVHLAYGFARAVVSVEKAVGRHYIGRAQVKFYLMGDSLILCTSTASCHCQQGKQEHRPAEE